jgi:hypothetical protein
MQVRKIFLSILITLGAVLAFAEPVQAQSDILLQLRSGSPATDRFRVDSAGGVVALGTIGYGIIPASGAGWRMMWYPNKVAFRAGYADAGGQFDESNIGYYSWAGGALSTAAGIYSFSMGNSNTVQTGAQAGMALGSGNMITTTGSFGVALGLNNDVLDAAGVAIGQNAWSDGDAAVALGYRTTADADYSMAFGYRASTNGHTGAKVFGDASTTDSIEAVANNEFAVRAAGGFRFRSNATLTNGCNIAAGGASITCASSKTLKSFYTPVNGEDILAKIRGLKIERWRYNDEEGQPWHLGPYSEDFSDAFGLGNDRLAIGHLDQMGVTMKGVQALDLRTLTLQQQLAEKEKRIAELEARLGRMTEIEARLKRLEAIAASKEQ